MYISHIFFFFNDTATTEIYTLSLHDALPISRRRPSGARAARAGVSELRAELRHGRHLLEQPPPHVPCRAPHQRRDAVGDRKSTRLNSSHLVISYAVFCLKKKKHITMQRILQH